MRRVKVTLSLREDLVRRVKSRLAIENRSFSEVVEELLQSYDQSDLLDKLCEELNFEKRFLSSSDIKAKRPRGLKAEEIVREVRDERSERLSRY